VNGDDLLWAMATLGFEDYLEPLKIYLARYREVCCFDSLIMCSEILNILVKRLVAVSNIEACHDSSFTIPSIRLV
jgi:hypothetical protein